MFFIVKRGPLSIKCKIAVSSHSKRLFTFKGIRVIRTIRHNSCKPILTLSLLNF
jgi:hypothetical protein